MPGSKPAVLIRTADCQAAVKFLSRIAKTWYR